MSAQKVFIKLSEEQRKELERGFKSGNKPIFRQRCHYILLSDRGYEIPQIAELYRVTRQLVGRWFERYKQQGMAGLHTAKGRGEKPILRLDNAEHVQTVKNLVDQHAQDLNPVLAALEEQLKQPLSKRTLHRFLKKLVTSGNASEE
ncbi:MAG: helix-turn-helix domain-containing protein [Bacteroidetes bacterium]|nr:helix-turn-helix domain-containing protein [Bacteroidota bacterium]